MADTPPVMRQRSLLSELFAPTSSSGFSAGARSSGAHPVGSASAAHPPSPTAPADPFSPSGEQFARPPTSSWLPRRRSALTEELAQARLLASAREPTLPPVRCTPAPTPPAPAAPTPPAASPSGRSHGARYPLGHEASARMGCSPYVLGAPPPSPTDYRTRPPAAERLVRVPAHDVLRRALDEAFVAARRQPSEGPRLSLARWERLQEELPVHLESLAGRFLSAEDIAERLVQATWNVSESNPQALASAMRQLARPLLRALFPADATLAFQSAWQHWVWRRAQIFGPSKGAVTAHPS